MQKYEPLYGKVVSHFESNAFSLANNVEVSPAKRNLHFGMNCNGYHTHSDERWSYNPKLITPFKEVFEGTRKSFFGPSGGTSYFEGKDNFELNLEAIFSQSVVINTIDKYRSIDSNLAARIAYIIGGLARHMGDNWSLDDQVTASSFVARMSLEGDYKSGEAIASSMAMYVMSGGSMDFDPFFTSKVQRMGTAIAADPVQLINTEDLGLSQVARLKNYLNPDNQIPVEVVQQLKESRDLFKDFPTTGAEFHLEPDSDQKYPGFVQRLALLNMSQYHSGSYIQLSRKDQEVWEIRMNPSDFPVTVANWYYLRLLMPEIKKTYFHTTYNRKDPIDFHTSNDREMVKNLTALGLFCYGEFYNTVMGEQSSGEISFGTSYIGQTLRFINGHYEFSGAWGNNSKNDYNGQLSIYTGYGDNFPHLIYYPSMALAEPNILGGVDYLKSVNSTYDYWKTSREQISELFPHLDRVIANNPRLSLAARASKDILKVLAPTA